MPRRRRRVIRLHISFTGCLMRLNLKTIDHFVLTVLSIKTTCDFYAKVLGMNVFFARDGRVSLHFGSRKINLHKKNSDITPKAHNPLSGSGDFCLIVSNPIEQVVKHLQSKGMEIIYGFVKRTGATGVIDSVYIRDPDNNLIEISVYRD